MADAADFYTGIVVDAYAALKSQTFDAAPYADFVRAHGEPGLEVGCGDGQPLLQLVAAGLTVDGVDSSPDMIERARAAARRHALDLELHVARMEEMKLGRRYASIYLAGPTFQLLPDDDLALRALDAFRQHLAPGGAIMIPLWIAGRTPSEQLGQSREAIDGTGATVRYTPLTEDHDPVTRTRRTITSYERTPSGGVPERVERTWLIHWQTRQTITELAARARLRVRAIQPEGDASSEQPGDEFTVTLVHAEHTERDLPDRPRM